MYNIEFYEDSNGYSQLWEFLDDLQKKAGKNKDTRIQHQQIPEYSISRYLFTLSFCRRMAQGLEQI